MSPGPRIVFVRFLTNDSPKLVPWAAHVRRVVGANPRQTVEPKPSAGILVWQLVSANNRQLARSADVYETFEDATDSARAVVSSRDDLVVDLVSELGRGVYGWYASLAGVPVMTCGRWYDSDRDRRHALELAVRSMSVATLHSGARLTHPTLMAGDRGTSA